MADNAPRRRNAGETVVRVASAAVLAPPVLLAAWFGGLWYATACALMAAIVLWEWRRLCAGVGAWSAMPLFYVGAVYIALASFMLFELRSGEPGRETVIWLLAVVWAADSAAYGAGRLIGGPKLAPAISPNKTWAGLIGAVTAATVCGGGLAALFSAAADVRWAACIGALAGLAAQGGDLLESSVKRRFGVKDAGALIPGHGGLMDRVDGLLAATVAVFLLSAARGPLLP